MDKNKTLGNVLIMGDSYSTFRGYIPEGYAAYYHGDGRPETDVRAVEETWWHQLIARAHGHLVLNDSFSGTTVSRTGWGGDTTPTCFTTRLNALAAAGFFAENRIDTCLVFGGTNDFWVPSPRGEWREGEAPAAGDLFAFFPSLAYLLTRANEVMPDARKICLVNDVFDEDFASGICRICAALGAEALLLSDIDKKCGHPTVRGMAQIAEQAYDFL